MVTEKKLERFYEIGKSLENAEEGKLFGKPCLKIKGKAFACFFESCMVFKLTGEDHTAALNLSGSKLFDPSGKNRPMKEWVQLPYEYESRWASFAQQSYIYVSN